VTWVLVTASPWAGNTCCSVVGGDGSSLPPRSRGGSRPRVTGGTSDVQTTQTFQFSLDASGAVDTFYDIIDDVTTVAV
jgi:hypothetical protein